MVEFVTLLLGLVVGTQAVEVSVSDEVARVEIRLDGKVAATLDGPPWFANCDFGTALVPHELNAVALDADGRELSSARQWVNLPRRRIEARLSLDRTSAERARARLIWAALDHDRAPEVELVFDGESLPFEDLDRIVLPPHDPSDLHFLRAELRFSATETASAELVFGGSFGDEVATELTALPVLADRRLPRVEEMDGWFQKQGRPLRVAAIERGQIHLLVVRERSLTTHNGLRFLRQRFEVQRTMTRLPRQLPRVLDVPDRVRFVFPTLGRGAAGRGGTRLDVEQVPVSLPLKVESPRARRQGQTPRPGQPAVVLDETRGFRSLFEILTNAFYTVPEEPAPVHQLADAVAIAGLVAATGDRRRLVLLVASGDSTDNSRFAAADVHGYLRELGVPLEVWTIPAGSADSRALSRWGEARDVSELKGATHALDELRETLQSQALVWIEGAHLRREIELTGRARGLRPIAGGPPPAAASSEVSWTTIAAGSRLHARPRRDAKLVGVSAGGLLEVLETRGLWLRVRDGDLTGWIDPTAPAGDDRPPPDRPVQATAGDASPATPGGEGWQTVEIGPHTLRSQVRDRGLLGLLDRAAGDHRRLFAERYGVAGTAPIPAEVLLFARERDYLEFKRAQGHSRAEVRATGYFEAPSLVVLHRGRDLRQEVAASLLHELTHLLSWHLLGEGSAGRRGLPTWLEEGLAEDLSLASIDRRRGLTAAPLGPGNLRYGRRLGDVLAEVAEKVDGGSVPALAELAGMDRAAFLAGDSQLHYVLSALWVRYLLDGSAGGLAEPFRAFLGSLAGGGPAGPEALDAFLGVGGPELERGFRSWLERQRRRLPPLAD